MQLSLISLALTKVYGGVAAFTPAFLFASGELGAWYDPSDLTTMFQDAEGTLPVTADGQPVGLILDKSKGLVLGPEMVTNGDFSDGVTGWSFSSATGSVESGALKLTNTAAFGLVYRNLIPTVIGKSYKVTCLVDASNGSAGILRVYNGSNIDSHIAGGNTAVATIIFTAVSTSINISCVNNSATVGAFARYDNISIKELPGNHASQATAASRPLYKTDGTLHWLQFDGVDDSLSTAAIDFRATDKMSQFYGVKRNTNTYGFVVEGGANALSTQGSIAFAGGGWVSAGAKYGAAMSGTSGAFSYDTDASYPAPITNVVSVQNDIALTNNYDELKLRINGAANSSGTYLSNPNVTGTFGNNIIYIGSRASSSLFLSGNIYSIIVRGAVSTTQEITDTETWVNQKTGAY